MSHEEEPDDIAPSQVGRPRRLTGTAVIDGAIELADAHGLEDLSMPKLARYLGVGTMTLYGYVDSKQDLLDQMAARIFEDLDVPDEENWRDGLAAFLSEFRESALAHPTLAALLATGRITIPAVFEILEQHLEAATRQGVPVEEAVNVFYAGLTYTIGFVVWEIPRAHLQTEADYAAQWEDLISHLDPERYPLLTGPGRTVVPSVASVHQFSWGLRRLLAP